MKVFLIAVILVLVAVPANAKRPRNVLRGVTPRQLERYCRGAGAGAAICPKYQPPCADRTDKTRDNGPTRPTNVICKS